MIEHCKKGKSYKKYKNCKMKKDKKYISVKEASGYLGIPLRTVYHLVKSGKIRSVRLGGRIRCLREDVLDPYDKGTFDPSVKDTCKVQAPERRRTPRINAASQCSYKVDLEPLRSAEGEGMVKNLSSGGVFLLIDEKSLSGISSDDPVNVSFGLSFPGEENIILELAGRVLRKEDTGLAIKFRSIPEKEKQLIEEYIG
ncbi:MAG: helix-turn-helix domain-containing protein [Candidatus Omnitrophica bacterium]|nr:helix-turn-helix domain-containing protein [Candidatus Omnitrophota bacterium]